ncbi:ADP-ribosylglycohydrolase family protein [Tenacibaculum tangerinum]|uniref:ADP-ribosylglycohydrolase family protein n=1 Tax=Tenacibaculum tangerinum TaxID=3038772 RepID=A0ABY8L1H8_9FLAO|nr:ADP-ribosylglycohydrolase family protein [Tenacibaculum tangerinum]WGH75311.1 ADP-ribosylglycohydrolase family protein [Tenacibaculum tangerinum]
MSYDNNTITATFLGLAIADALGVPVEFKDRETLKLNPVKDMRAFGTHYQPKGTWSDDSSLTFCLAESLCNGYDLKDISSKFIQWMNAEIWTPHGSVFDIGIQTRKAIEQLIDIINKKDYKELELLKYSDDEYTNGNGSLMRIIPLLFFIKNKSIHEQFDIIWHVSSLTHPHIRAAIACLIYLKFGEYILKGETIQVSYKKMKIEVTKFLKERKISEYEQKYFSRILSHDIQNLKEDEIQSGGYVVHTLEASLWCLLTSSSYKEVVLKAVNLGNDTDTTATVVGAIAGMHYGIESIPKEWIESLAKKEDIILLNQQFAKKYSHEN